MSVAHFSDFRILSKILQGSLAKVSTFTPVFNLWISREFSNSQTIKKFVGYSIYLLKFEFLQYFHSTTRMLVVVIIIFLLIEIPAAAIYILHIYLVTQNVQNADYHSINIALIFRNVMIPLSYPINFAVYCGMSRQFRLTVLQLFTRETLYFTRPPQGLNRAARYSVIMLHPTNGHQPSPLSGISSVNLAAPSNGELQHGSV